jgi:hypothetical protein
MACQTSRQVFQLAHGDLVNLTAMSLHLLLILLWHSSSKSVRLDMDLLVPALRLGSRNHSRYASGIEVQEMSSSHAI